MTYQNFHVPESKNVKCHHSVYEILPGINSNTGNKYLKTIEKKK